MLLMRAGAALPAGLRDVILMDYERHRRQLADDFVQMGTPGKLFVTQRLCEEIKRYDIRGGRTFRLGFQLPVDFVRQGGSRYRKLPNEMSSFTCWEQLCSRELLPEDERTNLRAMPKLWEMDGVVDFVLKEDEATLLPRLFHAMKKSATVLALNGRIGSESPLRVLAPDILYKILCGCISVPDQFCNLTCCPTSDLKMMADYREAHGQAVCKPEESQSDAAMLKAEGGAAFAKKDYVTAANMYSQALGALAAATTEEDVALKVILHSNVAEACLRMEKWDSAVDHAEHALQLDPTHAKSMRRLGTARERQSAPGRRSRAARDEAGAADRETEAQENGSTGGLRALQPVIQEIQEQMAAASAEMRAEWDAGEGDRQAALDALAAAVDAAHDTEGWPQDPEERIAAEALAASVQIERLAAEEHVSASGRAQLRRSALEAQHRTKLQREFAKEYTCPQCGTEHRSVMPETEEKWMEQGCPDCPIPGEEKEHDGSEPEVESRCASLALSLLPLIFSYKSEKSFVWNRGAIDKLAHLIPLAESFWQSELPPLQLSQLRERAESLGASQDDIDAADDTEDPKSALVELVRSPKLTVAFSQSSYILMAYRAVGTRSSRWRPCRLPKRKTIRTSRPS